METVNTRIRPPEHAERVKASGERLLLQVPRDPYAQPLI
jgi:hypothetical protein